MGSNISGHLQTNPHREFVNLARKKKNYNKLREALDHDPELVNVQSPSGRTALHKASESNNVEIVELLLKRRANVNSVDNMMMTPLLWACRSECTAASILLIEKGADLSAFNEEGQMALHFACMNRMGDVAILLVEGYSEATKIKNKFGKFPMDLWDEADVATNLFKKGKLKPKEKLELIAVIEDLDLPAGPGHAINYFADPPSSAFYRRRGVRDDDDDDNDELEENGA